MIEPKFRGFCLKENDWKYGFGWMQSTEGRNIALLSTRKGTVLCDINSMGQLVGKDSNGEEIYTGDILHPKHRKDMQIVLLTPERGEYYFQSLKNGTLQKEKLLKPLDLNNYCKLGNKYEIGIPLHIKQANSNDLEIVYTR